MESAATTSPTITAPAVSTPDSTSRCCTSRLRVAPSALRMANSRPRPSARAMSKVTAFAHAMSRHAADGGERQQDRRSGIADDTRLEILDAPRRLLVLIRRLPDRKQSPIGGVQRLDGRLARDVRPQPAKRHREERALALGCRPVRDREHRDVVLEGPDIFLQDADDRVAAAVDRNRAPDHIRIARESLRPVRSRSARRRGCRGRRRTRRTAGRGEAPARRGESRIR